MGFSNSIPASFAQNHYVAAGTLGDLTGGTKSIPFKDLKFAPNNPISITDAFSGRFDFSSFINGTSWTFITAPADVSWTTNNAATRVDMFGTNNPPVVSGTKGMRDLRLGNALVEGFGRNVSVQGKISALENLLNYKLNPTAGFVNVPVYQVKVSDKVYGDQGYFVFKSVTVKETMRDLRGDSTRAYVDIEMMQVPAFQVSSGVDQASSAITGAKTNGASIKTALGQNLGTTKPIAGPGAGSRR
jgi:hypothetical protein